MTTPQTPAQPQSSATAVAIHIKDAAKSIVLHISDIDAVLGAVLAASGYQKAAQEVGVFGSLIANAIQKYEDAQAVDITAENALELFSDHFALDKPGTPPSEQPPAAPTVVTSSGANAGTTPVPFAPAAPVVTQAEEPPPNPPNAADEHAK